MFYRNFVRLCNERGVKPTNVVLELRIGKGSVTRWKHGSIPYDTNLQKLAEYFGVTEEELLADDPTVETKKEPPRERRDGFRSQLTPMVLFALFGDHAAELSDKNIEDLMASVDAIIEDIEQNDPKE